MKLIFAQGNPGKQYEKTRHNIGFIVLDALKESLGGSGWKKSTKGNAEISEASLDGEKILLVKPLSYYNETGLVARALVDFYKLAPADDVLVIHDDLALPFGVVRVRRKGSDAGNNGIKSLNAHLGANYARIRIGIYGELRDRMEDSDFVLSTLKADEAAKLQELIEAPILPLVNDFLLGSLEETSYLSK